MAVLHAPVLVSETLALLEPSGGGLFVDCTVGLGGHSRALLEAGASRVLGLDRDADALELAAAELAPFGDRVELVHADYRDLEQVLDGRGIAHIAGALADLGPAPPRADLLVDLQDRLGVAILFISHDLSVVRNLAHRVLVMHRGRAVETGDVEQIFAAPQQDYTRRLLSSIPPATRAERGRLVSLTA